MSTDIGQMNIKLGIDSSQLRPGLDQAGRITDAGVRNLMQDMAARGKAIRDALQSPEQKAGVRFNAHVAELDRNLKFGSIDKDTHRQAKEMARQQLPAVREAAAQKLELEKRLEEVRRSTLTAKERAGEDHASRVRNLDALRAGGLDGATYAKAVANSRKAVSEAPTDGWLEELSRKTVMRFGHVPAAAFDFINTAREKSMAGIGVEAHDVVGTFSTMGAGIVSAIDPVAGAIVSVIGGALTSLVSLIDDVANRAARSSFKIVDKVTAGQATISQAYTEARQQDIDYAERSHRARASGGAVGFVANLVGAGNIARELDPLLAARAQESHDAELRRIASGGGDIESHFRGQSRGASRALIESNATVRAQGQMRELAITLRNTSAAEGLSADGAQRLGIAQDFAARSGLSLERAQNLLAGSMRELAGMQTATATSQARDQVNETTRGYLAQAAAIGRTAFVAEDAGRRFAAVQAHVQRTGMTWQAATNQLAGVLAGQTAAAAAQAQAQFTGTVRNTVQQQNDLVNTFQSAATLQQSQRGLGGEAPTMSQESLQRQQQMAQLDRERQRMLAEGNRAENEDVGQRAILQQRLADARQRQEAIEAAGQGQAPQWEVAVNEGNALQQQLNVLNQQAGARGEQRNAALAQLDADRARLPLLDAGLRTLEMQRAAQQEAFQLTMSLRSPAEQFNAELTRMADLRVRGGLSDQAIGRGLREQTDRLEGQVGGPIQYGAPSLQQGSQAAVAAINRYNQQREDPVERLIRIQEQARTLQREQADIERRLLDAVRSGRIVAPARL